MIISCVSLKPFFLAINLDIVSSSNFLTVRYYCSKSINFQFALSKKKLKSIELK